MEKIIQDRGFMFFDSEKIDILQGKFIGGSHSKYLQINSTMRNNFTSRNRSEKNDLVEELSKLDEYLDSPSSNTISIMAHYIVSIFIKNMWENCPDGLLTEEYNNLKLNNELFIPFTWTEINHIFSEPPQLSYPRKLKNKEDIFNMYFPKEKYVHRQSQTGWQYLTCREIYQNVRHHLSLLPQNRGYLELLDVEMKNIFFKFNTFPNSFPLEKLWPLKKNGWIGFDRYNRLVKLERFVDTRRFELKPLTNRVPSRFQTNICEELEELYGNVINDIV